MLSGALPRAGEPLAFSGVGEHGAAPPRSPKGTVALRRRASSPCPKAARQTPQAPLRNRNKPGIEKARSWRPGGEVDQFGWPERSMQQRPLAAVPAVCPGAAARTIITAGGLAW